METLDREGCVKFLNHELKQLIQKYVGDKISEPLLYKIRKDAYEFLVQFCEDVKIEHIAIDRDPKDPRDVMIVARQNININERAIELINAKVISEETYQREVKFRDGNKLPSRLGDIE